MKMKTTNTETEVTRHEVIKTYVQTEILRVSTSWKEDGRKRALQAHLKFYTKNNYESHEVGKSGSFFDSIDEPQIFHFQISAWEGSNICYYFLSEDEVNLHLGGKTLERALEFIRKNREDLSERLAYQDAPQKIDVVYFDTLATELEKILRAKEFIS